MYKDLDQMVDYVKSHPKVAATLREIDLQKKIIRFGAGCKVIFQRKTSTKATGMVGPAEPLVVKRSSLPSRVKSELDRFLEVYMYE